LSSERVPTNGSTAHSRPFHYHSVLTENHPAGDAKEGKALFSFGENDFDGMASVEQREKVAFERGIQEGDARARLAFDQQLGVLRTSVAASIEQFKTQREDYFARIEPEVVQLALAIARKILHREAQMDPLLLTGIVHVALEKLDAGARVRLRTHPGDIHFWNQYFSQPGSFQPAPDLIGDPTLQPGELALETEIGSTQISLETQLKEIEQGFFDLLEQRPRVR
jgi:flagellar assembly protein FliH